MQRNFTTREQSKRLIDIGIPISTADCWLDGLSEGVGVCADQKYTKEYINDYRKLMPSWSAGRLIELIFLFTEGVVEDEEKYNVTIYSHGYIQGIVESLVQSLEVVKDKLNFSKIDFSLNTKEENERYY